MVNNLEAGPKQSLYVGVDPGKGGGLAAVDITGRLMLAARMPGTDGDLLACVRALSGGGWPRAMLELVHSSPQMGVSSAFTFGRGFGALCVALQAAEIPYDLVSPGRWQKAMGLTRGAQLGAKDKDAAKQAAQRMFPAAPLSSGDWTALADALLLAEYCRRVHTGTVSAPPPPPKQRARKARTELF